MNKEAIGAHDAPHFLPISPEVEVSRRQVLVGGLAVTAGSYFLLHWPFSIAQEIPASRAIESNVTPEHEAFMRFSVAITGHENLHPITAQRIHQAISDANEVNAAQLERLAGLVQENSDPNTLLASATNAGLEEMALAVVAAWYTGTVDMGEDAIVVAYPEALMYRTVQDGQTVRTYCRNGPAWWVQDPPPAGVSPPDMETMEEPETTGLPVDEDAPAVPETAPN